MIKRNSYLIDAIMSNPVTFGILNVFLDSIQSGNSLYMAYDIEYVARLVAIDEVGEQKFLRKHKTDSRYMRMYRIALDIRQELKDEMLNLKDCMSLYEAL